MRGGANIRYSRIANITDAGFFVNGGRLRGPDDRFALLRLGPRGRAQAPAEPALFYVG